MNKSINGCYVCNVNTHAGRFVCNVYTHTGPRRPALKDYTRDKPSRACPMTDTEGAWAAWAESITARSLSKSHAAAIDALGQGSPLS